MIHTAAAASTTTATAAVATVAALVHARRPVASMGGVSGAGGRNRLRRDATCTASGGGSRGRPPTRAGTETMERVRSVQTSHDETWAATAGATATTASSVGAGTAVVVAVV